jgi:pimeloyl-ACP methyl ester carboxylesterase
LSIDHELLRSLASFEDAELGVRERFLTPEFHGTATSAVLSSPLGEARPTGWLICGSFGPEEAALTPFRVQLARALAGVGFPVLRYHSRGYGDSRDRGAISPGPTSQLADAIAAAGVLRTEAGPGSIGVLGAGFGGAIAALAATHAGAAFAVLIQPVAHGAAFLRSLVVRALAVDAGEGARRPAADGRGVLDLDGFAVPPDVAKDLEQLDVAQGAAGFGGRTLILEVARTAEKDAAPSALAVALGSAEGRCTIERIVHPDAHRFGLPRIRKVPGRGKTDVQTDLSASIVASVVAWCSEVGDASANQPVSA